MANMSVSDPEGGMIIMKSDQAKMNKRAYDIDYNMKNITQKRINFNKNNDEDVMLLSWVNRQKNQSQYMKSLIRNDMEGSGK